MGIQCSHQIYGTPQTNGYKIYIFPEYEISVGNCYACGKKIPITRYIRQNEKTIWFKISIKEQQNAMRGIRQNISHQKNDN